MNQSDQQVGIDKNKDEYNATADDYEKWSESNIIMQRYCYYSTVAEIEKQVGIEGKVFMEVGCGPCPIGQKLAAKGAKKIYGLDISEQMIASARTKLDGMGIGDKFELIAQDIFDENFQAPEKVDCVVFSYVLTAFITNEDMLKTIFERSKRFLKKDGIVLVTDFSYAKIECDGFWCGMTSEPDGLESPREFESFIFRIDRSPD